MPEKGKSATRKRPPRVAAVIRANLEALFEMAGRVPEFADRAGPLPLAAYLKAHRDEYGDTVGKSHLYRMLGGEGAVGADVLDMVARAFGLEAWHMLVPGMDPQNPPSVLVSEGQRRLFRELTESYREIAKPEAYNAQGNTAGAPDPRRDPARQAPSSGNVRRKAATGKTRPKAKAKAEAGHK